ncbi:MAG: hypothetical protein L0L41_09230, partial [Acetobacter sp.]|nr:hypothetical protein [Acetobacter sp.]
WKHQNRKHGKVNPVREGPEIGAACVWVDQSRNRPTKGWGLGGTIKGVPVPSNPANARQRI